MTRARGRPRALSRHCAPPVQVDRAGAVSIDGPPAAAPKALGAWEILTGATSLAEPPAAIHSVAKAVSSAGQSLQCRTIARIVATRWVACVVRSTERGNRSQPQPWRSNVYQLPTPADRPSRHTLPTGSGSLRGPRARADRLPAVRTTIREQFLQTRPAHSAGFCGKKKLCRHAAREFAVVRRERVPPAHDLRCS
jgi:hypothetical protein